MPSKKPTHRKGRKMAFFFYEKDYPDMRKIIEELKQLTGKKRAITIMHLAARRMLRQEKERATAIEQTLAGLRDMV